MNSSKLTSIFIDLVEQGAPNEIAGVVGIRPVQAKDKFYLYRVYEDNEGVFELVELSDPLDDDATERQYQINPFHSERSRRWSVIEIKESEEEIPK